MTSKSSDKTFRDVIYTNLINCRWAFVIMEGGNEDGKGVHMINANAELILQHPGPLITHATQYFLPSHFVISIHIIVDQHAEECHHHDPEHQKLWEPSPVGLNKSVPSFRCHLLIQPHSQRLVVLHLQTHQHKIRNLSASSIASFSSCSPFNHLIPKLEKTSRIHSFAETHIYKLTFLKY